MLLGYNRKFIAEQLKKLNIFVSPRQVTEDDVRLVEKMRQQQLRHNLLMSRLRG